MSRFVNLEFEGQFEENGSQSQVTKDEAWYLQQAQARFESGDWEMALRLFGKVLEFNPKNTTAWSGQVRMLIELGELREARLWADKALERFPEDPELLAAKAVALGRLGDLQGAMAFSDASIQERGETPYVWLARADVLLARKEPTADFCFQKAQLLARGSWVIEWLAGRIRFFYEQFTLALKHFQTAVELNPAQCILWLDMGLCQESLGFAGPARQSLAQAIQLQPGCGAAREALARVNSMGASGVMRGWWQRLLGR